MREIALIGYAGDIGIQVYTDHKPDHFHAIKEDCYDVRIVIPNHLPNTIADLKVDSYKWMKSPISNKDKKIILRWMRSPDPDTNLLFYFLVKRTWKMMNPADLQR